jgi:hypothetical protein
MSKTLTNKISNFELQKIYKEKYEYYSKFTLEELKAVFEESKKSKKTRLGGTYKQAFLDVVTKKQLEESIKGKIEELKEDEKKE